MSSVAGTLVRVVCADVNYFKADVVALKYAQGLYGADSAVHARLGETQQAVPMPKVGDYVLHDTHGSLGTRAVLFVGVPPLRNFGYSQIRDFARRVVEVVSAEAPEAKHVALTIHGPGYGLDEVEAFASSVAGIVDGLTSLQIRQIDRITFVERNQGRAERLKAELGRLLPNSEVPNASAGGIGALADDTRATLRTAGYGAAAKPRVFVAMSFAEEMEDVFHYGIQGASNAAGLLCERADLATFTGDVMAWVKERISTARLLIADLSSANANVYLEVGYAWGCGVPTILLCRDVAADLKFDVRGHRCLVYKSIKHLEGLLSRELANLVQTLS